MPEDSIFRGIINFLVELGIYDVILPFILVFTIMFAILEKTKVFGTEKYGDEVYTRKNINAMASFVIGFLVVVSGELVSIINKSLGNIVILLFVIVSFLILIGSFFKEDEDVFLKEGPWRTWFMIAVLVAVILIFLNAIPTSDGGSNWLEWISMNWDTNWVGTIVLLILIIIFMAYLVRDQKPREKSKNDS